MNTVAKPRTGHAVASLVNAAHAVIPNHIAAIGDHGRQVWVDSLAGQVRKPTTYRAWVRATHRPFDWPVEHVLHDLEEVEPVHVATRVVTCLTEAALPTVKQELAAKWSVFDRLVVCQMVVASQTAAVRDPKHSVPRGMASVLWTGGFLRLLRSTSTDSFDGLRDRALMAVMTCSFVRISAALGTSVRGVFETVGCLWLRLAEKGGKVPCHHNLEAYLTESVETAGIRTDRDGARFRALVRDGSILGRRLNRQGAWKMIGRRARASGINSVICDHTFGATGIAARLEHPEGRVKMARCLADHAKPETTRLCDRRQERVSLDEIARI